MASRPGGPSLTGATVLSAEGRGPRWAGAAGGAVRPTACVRAHLGRSYLDLSSLLRRCVVALWLPQMKTPAASVSYVSRRHTPAFRANSDVARLWSSRVSAVTFFGTIAPSRMAALVFAGSL